MQLRRVVVEAMAQAYYASYTGYAGSRLPCRYGFARYAVKRITMS